MRMILMNIEMYSVDEELALKWTDALVQLQQ